MFDSSLQSWRSGQRGLMAGGTRSVGMTVNSSGKPLHSVLCATIRRSRQCPTPHSLWARRIHGAAPGLGELRL